MCAPAGFGKSVAVSQWCETLEPAVAWLSLDALLAEPRWFVAHLVAAVRGVFPDSMPVTSQLVDSATFPSTPAVLTELSNELEELPAPIVIVLDDLHEVVSPTCWEILGELLRHPPAPARFVMISRHDPPLPTEQLRARGQLVELRAADLALTRDEIAVAVRQALDLDLSERQLDNLVDSTEGWPAGIRFTIHRLRHSDPDTATGVGSLDHATQEYLVAEVLARVPPPVRQYLLVVSLFDRFSAELCDDVIGHSASRPSTMTGGEFVRWLQQNELFIIRLDDHDGWFRFHHLFARLLDNWRKASALGSESSERAIRCIAADVFVRHGLIEDALQQYELAGQRADLADVACEYGNELLERERWPELERLLAAVPQDVFDTEPALLVLKAWLRGYGQYHYAEMVDLLDHAERLLQERSGTNGVDPRAVRGEIAALRAAYVKYIGGDFEGAVDAADSALHLLAELPGRELSFAYCVAIIARVADGRSWEGHRLANSLLGDERFARSPFDPMAWVLPQVAWLEGDLALMERTATQFLALATAFDVPGNVGKAEYSLGTAAYERHRLADAEVHLRRVSGARYSTTAAFAANAAMALALTELAQGRPDDADATAASMMQFVLDVRSEITVPIAEAFMAELDLRQGRLADALHWVRRGGTADERHRHMFYDPGPTLIEVLLSSDSEADITRGRELLDQRLALAEERHHHPLTLRLLGLRALDLAKQGNEPGALDALRTAVTMSHQSGMIRRLADLGPALAPLLHRLDVTDELLTHVGILLAALQPATTETGTEMRNDTIRAVSHIAGEPSLTDRELDVLVMLADRYSNKEIARQLLIAPATVKKHTVTLYDKLNVHSRNEAVTKARTLGYLPDLTEHPAASGRTTVGASTPITPQRVDDGEQR